MLIAASSYSASRRIRRGQIDLASKEYIRLTKAKVHNFKLVLFRGVKFKTWMGGSPVFNDCRCMKTEFVATGNVTNLTDDTTGNVIIQTFVNETHQHVVGIVTTAANNYNTANNKQLFVAGGKMTIPITQEGRIPDLAIRPENGPDEDPRVIIEVDVCNRSLRTMLREHVKYFNVQNIQIVIAIKIFKRRDLTDAQRFVGNLIVARNGLFAAVAVCYHRNSNVPGDNTCSIYRVVDFGVVPMHHSCRNYVQDRGGQIIRWDYPNGILDIPDVCPLAADNPNRSINIPSNRLWFSHVDANANIHLHNHVQQQLANNIAVNDLFIDLWKIMKPLRGKLI